MAKDKKTTAADLTADAAENKAVKKKAEKKKSDKPSIWQKIGNFFRNYKSEFKKVSWYPWNSTVNNSLVVLVAIVASMVVLMILDYGYQQSFVKLKDLVDWLMP